VALNQKGAPKNAREQGLLKLLLLVCHAFCRARGLTPACRRGNPEGGSRNLPHPIGLLRARRERPRRRAAEKRDELAPWHAQHRFTLLPASGVLQPGKPVIIRAEGTSL
jgi:hypothetical protein